jgi:hypothetical protein
VHAFAGTTSTLFVPALAASSWLLGIKEFLPELDHVSAILYLAQVGGAEFKLFASIVYDLFFG